MKHCLLCKKRERENKLQYLCSPWFDHFTNFEILKGKLIELLPSHSLNDTFNFFSNPFQLVLNPLCIRSFANATCVWIAKLHSSNTCHYGCRSFCVKAHKSLWRRLPCALLWIKLGPQGHSMSSVWDWQAVFDLLHFWKTCLRVWKIIMCKILGAWLGKFMVAKVWVIWGDLETSTVHISPVKLTVTLSPLKWSLILSGIN